MEDNLFMSNIINSMISQGIINDKSKFIHFLNKNNLTIKINKVDAVAYKGQIIKVPMNDEELFICPCCKKYSITANKNSGQCLKMMNEYLCWDCYSNENNCLCYLN
jgi:hypothetical protein